MLSFAKLGASRDSYLALNAVKIISTCMTKSSSRLACNHALSLHLCNLFSVCLTYHMQKSQHLDFFSDWIGDKKDDLRRSDWPKCHHPLVVVDFSLHFCFHIIEQ